VSLNDTMTMGDNFNDYSMLELCPNSITLSTAPFEVRQVAKVVIDKPASEFVGEAIKMFINNKNKK
jgi:hydroxymethylpyrimidine pyrophosphatase-like HAD family hydrolase